MLSGGSDGSIRVWNVQELRPLKRINVHTRGVAALVSYGTVVFTGGLDGRVCVLDTQDPGMT